MDLLSDFRCALRACYRSPGFASAAVLTVALGIGANTAIFSVVNAVLLRPLPFGDADRIVQVWTATADEPQSNHAAGEFLDIQRENLSLTAIAGYRSGLFTVTTGTSGAIQLEGAFVTVDFFDVLRVEPLLGRTFSRGVDAVPSERFVVLSTGASRQLYGEAGRAIGQSLRVNAEPHTVLGVLPARAEWPLSARLWVLSQRNVPPSPVDLSAQLEDRNVRYFDVIARLRPDLTIEQAQRDMNRLASLLEQRRTQSSAATQLRLGVLHEQVVRNVRVGLLMMQLAVGLVLLIACANVSGLVIARAAGRHRELAIRSSLGAGPMRLIRQLLIESIVLGLIGGAGGLLLGVWMVAALAGVLPDGIPRSDEIALDRVVAVVTFLVALAAGVVFGIMPALQASRADAASALKSGGERGSSGRGAARAALVVGEIALTLVLLAGAGLLLKSFLRLQSVDSGLKDEHVTMVGLVLPEARYRTGAAQTEVYTRIVEALSSRGEVRAVGVGFPGPLQGGSAAGSFLIEARPVADEADRPHANLAFVSDGYFEAMGVPLLAGRTFTRSDTAEAPEVAIASVALARKYWLGEDAVGKRLRFDDDPTTPWRTIVGVVGDVRQLGLDHDPPPIMYIPYRQFPLPFTSLALRSSAPEPTIASLVRSQVASIDPDLPLGDISTLRSILDRSVAQPRFRALLISAFAVAALVLAAVGLFGLISFAVTQRTREIGIRVALGAQPGAVLRAMMREGLTLVGLGVALGLVGTLAFSRVLGSFLYAVEPTDPFTLVAVSGVLVGVTLLAIYLPSRRALRVDPISALRAD